MNINETSSYKKTERLLFKQNCLKRSLSYVELQVGFEPTTCSLQVSCTTTVLLKPLGVWWGSNPRPPEPQPGTLPTELQTPYKLQMDSNHTSRTEIWHATNYTMELFILLVAPEGIEPSLTGPKPVVLPLYHRASWVREVGLEPTKSSESGFFRKLKELQSTLVAIGALPIF